MLNDYHGCADGAASSSPSHLCALASPQGCRRLRRIHTTGSEG
ncbi:rCG25838 [Rattus norvegicus]|uniref:RCG25838 n=1 Tax=Rattus norvegicus TaxID=10116 RepID=A6I1W4_RAT|nr:rCG25838 [Rattus norvegicus]